MAGSDHWFVELQRRWSRMPKSNRVGVATLTGMALFVATLSLGYHQTPRNELLLAGQTFSARELIELEGAFAKNSLADYEIVGAQVQIPRGRRSEYVAAVVDAQLLPSSSAVFVSSPSAFETTGQRAARERENLQRELSACVCRFHDIEDANVRIDEALTGHGFQRAKKVTSMVVLQPTQGPLTAQRIRSICRLVASAKVELDENDVTVTDLSTGKCYRGANDLVLRREEIQRDLDGKLDQALEFIPGATAVSRISLDTPAVRAPHASSDPLPVFIDHIEVTVQVPEEYYQAAWTRHREATGDTEADAPAKTTLTALEYATREKIMARIRPLLSKTVSTSRTEDALTLHMVTAPGHATIAASQTPLVVGGVADWFRAHVVWSVLGILAATCLAFYALRGLGTDLHRLWIAREQGHALRVIRDSEIREMETESERRRTKQNTESEEERQRNATSVAATVASMRQHQVTDQQEAMVQLVTEATDGVFTDGQSPIHEEITQIVRENPDAAADMLKQWIDKAG